MSAPPFEHSHRVTYADCTVGNHVYYARFLEILEAARGEFLRQVGCPLLDWQNDGFMFPVVEARLRYQALARYDEVLRVVVWVSTAEKVRLNFGYEILNPAGKVVLQAETHHVCMSRDEKLKRLPAALVAVVQPHLRAASAGLTPR
jgi:acyl-CoA thioester hydrolase